MNHCLNPKCRKIHADDFIGQCGNCGGRVAPGQQDEGDVTARLEARWRRQDGGMPETAFKSLGQEGSAPRERVEAVKSLLFGDANA